MAKKWKAYPWPDRVDDDQEITTENNDDNTAAIGRGLVVGDQVNLQEKRDRSENEEEEIDVVGDVDNRQGTQTCWSPHSPTAGATAPSPPPLNASGALYYHGKIDTFFPQRILSLGNFHFPLSTIYFCHFNGFYPSGGKILIPIYQQFCQFNEFYLTAGKILIPFYD